MSVTRSRNSLPQDRFMRDFSNIVKLGAFVLIVMVGLLMPDPAAAQNATTTGQIRGNLTGSEGQPVPGVLVTAVNEQTGVTRSTLTGENGLYMVRLLPSGAYTVTTEIIGYRPEEVSGVQVAIGQTSTVNLVLTEEAVGIEGIRVVADREGIDVSDASVMDMVSRAEIEELPALGRDFTDFINLSGVVAPDPGETTGGQFSIAGQRGSQTNLQIDGVDANNAFFGENRGGSRIPFVFSLESIEEFQVITNGYDVEYGSYSGGIVNVVTRGGTNEFSGTLYANYRSDALTGRGFLEGEEVEEYNVAQYAGRVSGPIAEDKAFYSVSFDAQRRREPQIPLTLSQYQTGSDADPALASEVERFFQILENTYGIQNPSSGYQSFQTTNDVLSIFGRVDWNITQDHRLSLRHNYADYENAREFSPYYDSYLGVSRAENLSDESHSFVTELQSVLGQQTFNVLRFQYATEERPREGNELRPALITRLSNGDLIGYGGTFVAFHNNLEESKFQLIDNFTHVVGDHTLKVGFNGIFTTAKNWFLPPFQGPCGRGSQGAGVFCFDDLDALAAGTPSRYMINVNQGDDLIPYSEMEVSEIGVYIQDEWQVTPKLTVTAGLRHDRQDFRDDPERVIDVERALGYPTGTAPTDNDNISPRLAVAYDIDGDGRSVLRGGAGYFFGRVPYVLAGNVEGSQRPIYNLNCDGSVVEGDLDAPPSPTSYGSWSDGGYDNPTACRGGSGLSGVPTYTVWNPDFEYPETFKANLGYETLLTDRTRLSTDLMFSQSTNLYTVRNLNLRNVQFELANEGNRRIFTPEAVFSPSGGNTEAARIYTSIGDVYANYNDGRARSWVASLELSHNLNETSTVRGSYTYTRSYDNSSYSCCTAGGGFANPSVGQYGPNDIGGFGAEEKAWGPSDFERRHTFILSGQTRLPYGFQVSAIWRLQSGRPFTPSVGGDLNGDGVLYNDRPFIFAPEDLPLDPTLTTDEVKSAVASYAELLNSNECVGDYVGQIIPRNTCRGPWTNMLDMRITKRFPTLEGQRAELQVDLFNVLNGVSQLFCSDEEFADDPTSGVCGWGRFTTVSGSSQNIFFSPTMQDGVITYGVSNSFGEENVVGSNLLLQFQAQIGLKYYF